MNPWMLLMTAFFFSIAVYFSSGETGFLAVGSLVLFNLVTLHLVQLQKENDDLRARLDTLGRQRDCRYIARKPGSQPWLIKMK